MGWFLGLVMTLVAGVIALTVVGLTIGLVVLVLKLSLIHI